jgi:TonB family protein
MLLRPEASRSPRAAPVIVSLIAHMSVLATIAFSPPSSRKPESLYQREIAPREKKLVWYRFDKKLPDVSPQRQAASRKPPRAEVKHPNQTIVSKAPRSDPAKQTILTPGPELKIHKDIEAPNLMAFEAPKAPEPRPEAKLFMPPPEVARAVETPALENGPVLDPELRNLRAELPAPRVPKPAPKTFEPPPQVARKTEAPELQPGEARFEPAPMQQVPPVQIAGPPRPKPKVFTPPPPKPAPRTDAALTLPTAPALGPQASARAPGIPLNVAPPARPIPKRYTPPPPKPAPHADAAPELHSAPALGTQGSNPRLAASLPMNIAQPAKPQPKTFAPPPGRTARQEPAPALESPPSNLTAAVVGLNPINRDMPLLPDGSRPAQFSAAPEISRQDGGAGKVESAAITIPDLMIRGGSPKRESIASLSRVAPTSPENLLAAARPVITSAPAAEAAPMKAISGPVRVSAGPDPRFEGRAVFTVALQMPNVTSYSGSWILWYAERKPIAGESPELLPPSALRKVDPVYNLSAVDDRIEGKVQLAAVIHTDGYVYGITVLRGVDPRLDNSAAAALRKWEFEPAKRDGVPVDVDVVIEIPFRLRPPIKK